MKFPDDDDCNDADGQLSEAPTHRPNGERTRVH